MGFIGGYLKFRGCYGFLDVVIYVSQRINGSWSWISCAKRSRLNFSSSLCHLPNQKSLRWDLSYPTSYIHLYYRNMKAMRLGLLEQEMQKANAEYVIAVERASTSSFSFKFHCRTIFMTN
jgi:hypothetical protein